MKRTKIICTLGPAVDDEKKLSALVAAGMDVARFNFSHGTHAEHLERMGRLRRICAEAGSSCAVLLDTKGPEIRTGRLAGGAPVELAAGERITLTTRDIEGDARCVSQSASELPGCVEPGARILIDDGLIELAVERVCGDDIVCVIENGGVLGERKSVNVPGAHVPLPALTDRDRADLVFGVENDVDIVALSFVRSADDVRTVREFLDACGGDSIGLVAKIECAEAVENIDEIIAESDGIMVARGDLGVEIPEHRVPYVQKSIIRKCNRESKPVITATQMLDSMIRNPRPTRAEVTDVANAVYDGSDCVMLSGETASGAYPVEAACMMTRIVEEAESHMFELSRPDRKRVDVRASLAVGIAAVETAENLHAACIIAPTVSGRTARLISNLRPRMPIYAVTPSPRVMRRMQMSWGVRPLMDDMQGDMRHVIDCAIERVKSSGLVKPGDVAVLTAGDPATCPVEPKGSRFFGTAATNVMYVVEIK